MTAPRRPMSRPVINRAETAQRAQEVLHGTRISDSGAAARQMVHFAVIDTDVTWNPRGLITDGSYTPERLASLIESVRKHGVLQPLIVRPHPDTAGRYQLVAGFRRYYSAQFAGLNEVPVVIHELDDEVAASVSIIENTEREQLDDVDETFAVFGRMAQAKRMSVFEIARALKSILNTGKDPHELQALLTELSPLKLSAWANRRAKVLHMTEEEITAIRERRVSVTAAEQLVRLGDRPERTALLREVQETAMSTEALTARIGVILQSPVTAPEPLLTLSRSVTKAFTPRRFKALPEDRRARVEGLLLELQTLLGPEAPAETPSETPAG